MNTFSWFLYFVDISSGFRTMLWIAFACSLFAMVVVPRKGVKAFTVEHDAPFQGTTRPALWVLSTVLILLAISIPSKETLYMIGASEIGEQIVALEEVQALGGEVGGLASDTIALLRQNIQSQISAETP